jgi:hypothetical protein
MGRGSWQHGDDRPGGGRARDDDAGSDGGEPPQSALPERGRGRRARRLARLDATGPAASFSLIN